MATSNSTPVYTNLTDATQKISGRHWRQCCGVRSSTTSLQSWRRSFVKSELVKPTHLARKALVYRAPAPEVSLPSLAAWPAAQPRPAPPAMLKLVSKSMMTVVG